ncbi:hypothetical protein AU467_31255 [Mesorhizobium loti]|uniref:Uncharacterized protein n=1 Tax=Rhizobium loti TaxID=381 RepID=A0A117N1Z3_RHILI|nr:hypothetical protein AU467_31255 [Mesorhizobium loti]
MARKLHVHQTIARCLDASLTRQGKHDSGDPGSRRTFLKTDGDRTDNNLGAGDCIGSRRLRRGHLDNHGREFDRVFRLRQDQLPLPRQCSPG